MFAEVVVHETQSIKTHALKTTNEENLEVYSHSSCKLSNGNILIFGGFGNVGNSTHHRRLKCAGNFILQAGGGYKLKSATTQNGEGKTLLFNKTIFV